MKKRIIISFIVLLGLSGGILEYLYKQVPSYRCQDQRQRIPVLFKVYRSGLFKSLFKNGALLQALVHEKNGEIYVYSVYIENYSIFNKDYLYSSNVPGILMYKYTINLDLQAGSFYIHDQKTDKFLYSGLCTNT